MRCPAVAGWSSGVNFVKTSIGAIGRAAGSVINLILAVGGKVMSVTPALALSVLSFVVGYRARLLIFH